MIPRLLLLVVLAAGAATAQTRSTSDSSLPAACKGLGEQLKGLQRTDRDNSLDELRKMQDGSRDCLQRLLAALPERQKQAAHNALRLYGAAVSESEEQVRRQDAATARAESDEQMKHVAGQTAGLFARLGQLTYRYNEFLKQVSERQEQEDNSQATSSPAKPAASIVLPPKAEMLDCHDFRIGRFDACWPPDYD